MNDTTDLNQIDSNDLWSFNKDNICCEGETL